MSTDQHNYPKVSLSAANWIAIVSIALTQMVAGGVAGTVGYIQMDRRVTIIETTVNVLATERQNVTNSIQNSLIEIRNDQRELRTRVDKVLDGRKE